MHESLIDLAGLRVGAEDFLAAVLETTAQPIWVVDPAGAIRFANPAAIAALGYDSADELFGRHSHETIHGKHPDGASHPAADCPMLRGRATGDTVSCDVDWLARRDGSMFPVSYISVPIEMPEGRGAVVAFTDIEDRIRAEQVLGERDAVLEAQAASLRRVATLAAGGAASADVFAAVAREVGHVIGLPMVAVWRYEPDGTAASVIGAWGTHPHPFQAGTRWPLDGPGVVAQVLKTGRPARVDDYADVQGAIPGAARETGMRSSAAAPLIVDGQLWGAMVGASTDREPLPEDIEDQLAEFTALVAAAISNTEARTQVGRLADEQAALRRVATLVAQAVPPGDLFGAVTQEVGTLLGADLAAMARYENDHTLTVVATWAAAGEPPAVEARWLLEEGHVATKVFRTGRPARVEEYGGIPGRLAVVREELGVRSSVGTPIVVEGRVWGMLSVHSKQTEPLPVGTESRLIRFTELVATAMANAQARAEVQRLADEQAALRRVATLVAQHVPPDALFAAVTEEVGRLFRADLAGMIRYETDATVTPMATWAAVGEHPDVPNSWPLVEGDPAWVVAKTRRPARTDDWDDVPGPIAAFVRDELGISSSVGGPIVVDGRVWGALAVHSKQAGRFPAYTESRLESFTELVAAAMSNAEARAEVQRLADEQAALRRVATLVANDSPPGEVFAAVAEEVGRLLRVDATATCRYEADGTITVVAVWGETVFRLGRRVALDDGSVGGQVLRTGRSVRVDDYASVSGDIGSRVRMAGMRSAVGSPIVVDGRLWGVMIAASRQAEPLPAGTESRIGEFTELVATAISNVQVREDLAASRARVVAAADEERQRVVRDLHDGAQQRLVHTIITLKQAHHALQPSKDPASELVAEALDHAERANVELRELARGILPAVLARGLRAGVQALASRTPVPVEVDLPAGRLPARVEATAYFVIAEALTNVAKHARASRATVTARLEDGALRIAVRDNGVGGARPNGSGLLGLADRLAALDGRLHLESPAGGGTLIAADIPVDD